MLHCVISSHFNLKVAGTLRYAELKPDVPASKFPQKTKSAESKAGIEATLETHLSKQSKITPGHDSRSASTVFKESDEFSDLDIDDKDLIAAGMF